MRKSVRVLALSLALCGVTLAAAPAPAATVNGEIDRMTVQSLSRSLPVAEKQINANAAETEAVADAARAHKFDEVRKILIRNGVKEHDLDGIQYKVVDLAKRADGATTNECRITIKIGFGRYTITITIR